MTHIDYSLLLGRLEGKVDGVTSRMDQLLVVYKSLESRVAILEQSRMKMLGAAMFAGGAIAFTIQLKPWTFFS